MEDDQQFCLRWNNHQSTLVAVFDSLLERGQHVDVTLAAEGRTLRAHKVVLSACSPYFESVLSQQYDKHPIIILKDVKFAELRAMMDYMYRGEVNISQDQLGALLKAAESLQIKGLSDNKQPPPPTPPVLSLSPPPMKMPCLKESPCIDGEEESREGSISPTRRKRKKHRPSNSPINEMPRQSTPPATITNCSNTNPDDAELKSKPMDNIDAPATLTKTENNIDTNIEPKSEYGEDGIDDSVEDLTMEDEMDSEAEQGGIGSSQPIGDGSTQGYQWQTDRSHDEFNIGQDGQRDSQGESSQGTKIKNDSLKGSARNIDGPNLEYSDHDDKVNAQEENSVRDSIVDITDDDLAASKTDSIQNRQLPCAQYASPGGYTCPNCQRKYNARKNLVRHINLECGREPQYKCPHCPHGNHRRNELKRHIERKHVSMEIP